MFEPVGPWGSLSLIPYKNYIKFMFNTHYTKFVFAVLVAIICTIVVVSADTDVTSLICPFNEEEAGLAIGGYTIDAGMQVTSSAREGVILARSDMVQQVGSESSDLGTMDRQTEIQGYSWGLNGQGSWNYQGGWNTTVNDVDFGRVLNVQSGRMNPDETSLMMSYACPPSGEDLYSDNLTHVIGAEMAYAHNYGDIFIGGYATKGLIGPENLQASVAMVGTGLIESSAGYWARTGIAKNVTENETQTVYTVVGKSVIASTITVPVSKNAVVGTGYTQYHSYWIQSGEGMEFQSNFHFKAARAAPY